MTTTRYQKEPEGYEGISHQIDELRRRIIATTGLKAADLKDMSHSEVIDTFRKYASTQLDRVSKNLSDIDAHVKQFDPTAYKKPLDDIRHVKDYIQRKITQGHKDQKQCDAEKAELEAAKASLDEKVKGLTERVEDLTEQVDTEGKDREKLFNEQQKFLKFYNGWVVGTEEAAKRHQVSSQNYAARKKDEKVYKDLTSLPQVEEDLKKNDVPGLIQKVRTYLINEAGRGRSVIADVKNLDDVYKVIQYLDNTINAALDEKEQLEKSNDKATTRIGPLEGQVKTYEKENEQLKAEIDALRSTRKAADASFGKSIKELKQESQGIEKKLHEKEAQYNLLLEQTRFLWGYLRNIGRKVEKPFEEKMGDYTRKSLEKQLDSVLTALTDLRDHAKAAPEVPKMEKEIERLKSQKDALASEKTALGQQKSALDAQYDSMVKAVRHLGYNGDVTDFKALDDFMREQNKSYDALRSEHKTLQDEKASAIKSAQAYFLSKGMTEEAVKTITQWASVMTRYENMIRNRDEQIHEKDVAIKNHNAVVKGHIDDKVELTLKLDAVERQRDTLDAFAVNYEKNIKPEHEKLKQDYEITLGAFKHEHLKHLDTDRALSQERKKSASLEQKLGFVQSDPVVQSFARAYERNVTPLDTPEDVRRLVEKSVYVVSQSKMTPEQALEVVNALTDIHGAGSLETVHDEALLIFQRWDPAKLPFSKLMKKLQNTRNPEHKLVASTVLA